MSQVSNKSSNKLVQLKIPANIKSRLDEIFAKDGTTTPQGLKMIAIQIANRGFSPFTTMQYEQYTEPVSNRLKEDLRKDELKMMGYLYDDSEMYEDEASLKQAFKEKLKD